MKQRWDSALRRVEASQERLLRECAAREERHLASSLSSASGSGGSGGASMPASGGISGASATEEASAGGSEEEECSEEGSEEASEEASISERSESSRRQGFFSGQASTTSRPHGLVTQTPSTGTSVVGSSTANSAMASLPGSGTAGSAAAQRAPTGGEARAEVGAREAQCAATQRQIEDRRASASRFRSLPDLYPHEVELRVAVKDLSREVAPEKFRSRTKGVGGFVFGLLVFPQGTKSAPEHAKKNRPSKDADKEDPPTPNKKGQNAEKGKLPDAKSGAVELAPEADKSEKGELAVAKEEKETRWISAFVEARPTEDYPPHWYFEDVQFLVSLINFEDLKKSIVKHDKHTFSPVESSDGKAIDRGWHDFVHCDEATLRNNGFVDPKDDTVCFRASVYLAGGAMKVSPKTKLRYMSLSKIELSGPYEKVPNFLSSLVQLWYHIGYFRGVVYGAGEKGCTPPPGGGGSRRCTCVLSALREVFMRLQARSPPASCSAVCAAFGRRMWTRICEAEPDAFCWEIFRALETELTADVTKVDDAKGGKKAIKDPGKGTKKGETTVTNGQRSPWDAVRELFEFEVEWNAQAVEGGEFSESSIFQGPVFTFVVRGFSSLDMVLDHYFTPKYIEDGSGIRVKTSRRFRRLPLVLQWYLKRGDYDCCTGLCGLTDTYLEFPRQLDMSKYCEDGDRGDGCGIYLLYGVMVGSDDYYWSYIRLEMEGDQGRWYRFDDRESATCATSNATAIDASFGGEDWLCVNYLHGPSAVLTRPKESRACLLVYLKESAMDMLLHEPRLPKVAGKFPTSGTLQREAAVREGPARAVEAEAAAAAAQALLQEVEQQAMKEEKKRKQKQKKKEKEKEKRSQEKKAQATTTPEPKAASPSATQDSTKPASPTHTTGSKTAGGEERAEAVETRMEARASGLSRGGRGVAAQPNLTSTSEALPSSPRASSSRSSSPPTREATAPVPTPSAPSREVAPRETPRDAPREGNQRPTREAQREAPRETAGGASGSASAGSLQRSRKGNQNQSQASSTPNAGRSKGSGQEANVGASAGAGNSSGSASTAGKRGQNANRSANNASASTGTGTASSTGPGISTSPATAGAAAVGNANTAAPTAAVASGSRQSPTAGGAAAGRSPNTGTIAAGTGATGPSSGSGRGSSARAAAAASSSAPSTGPVLSRGNASGVGSTANAGLSDSVHGTVNAGGNGGASSGSRGPSEGKAARDALASDPLLSAGLPAPEGLAPGWPPPGFSAPPAQPAPAPPAPAPPDSKNVAEVFLDMTNKVQQQAPASGVLAKPPGLPTPERRPEPGPPMAPPELGLPAARAAPGLTLLGPSLGNASALGSQAMAVEEPVAYGLPASEPAMASTPSRRTAPASHNALPGGPLEPAGVAMSLANGQSAQAGHLRLTGTALHAPAEPTPEKAPGPSVFRADAPAFIPKAVQDSMALKNLLGISGAPGLPPESNGVFRFEGNQEEEVGLPGSSLSSALGVAACGSNSWPSSWPDGRASPASEAGDDAALAAAFAVDPPWAHESSLAADGEAGDAGDGASDTSEEAPRLLRGSRPTLLRRGRRRRRRRSDPAAADGASGDEDGGTPTLEAHGFCAALGSEGRYGAAEGGGLAVAAGVSLDGTPSRGLHLAADLSRPPPPPSPPPPPPTRSQQRPPDQPAPPRPA